MLIIYIKQICGKQMICNELTVITGRASVVLAAHTDLTWIVFSSIFGNTNRIRDANTATPRDANAVVPCSCRTVSNSPATTSVASTVPGRDRKKARSRGTREM